MTPADAFKQLPAFKKRRFVIFAMHCFCFLLVTYRCGAIKVWVVKVWGACAGGMCGGIHHTGMHGLLYVRRRQVWTQRCGGCKPGC